MRRDLGDFQTPPELVECVLDAMGPLGGRWGRVLEPTCGRGHFLAGILARGNAPRELRGIEVQPVHFETASRTLAAAVADANAHSQAIGVGGTGVDVRLLQADLFRVDLRKDLEWQGSGPLLVIGNPPWVTNAGLGVLGGGILPEKSNVKKRRGIDAMTGASNFDVAEAIWLKLIKELAHEEATIALLCKLSVARGILEFAERQRLPIAEASIFTIDARRWFKVVVDACLFRVTLGPPTPLRKVPIHQGLDPSRAPRHFIGFARGRIIADVEAYEPFRYADGECPLTWRQGLKHDAAAVMELTLDASGEAYRNKLGELVDVEPSRVYPLVKGSDLVPDPTPRPRRGVLVTQQRIGQETRELAETSPRLWAYLGAHAADFARRKSSIYKGQPPFALFGVGPYSFAPYKVAISGLHKEPTFLALGPRAGRPVMLDDTSYFLPCRTAEQAALTAALLNDPATLSLLRAITFRDAKRPITKAVLQRLDLNALAASVDQDALIERAERELARLLDGESREDDPLDANAGAPETATVEPASPPATTTAVSNS